MPQETLTLEPQSGMRIRQDWLAERLKMANMVLTVGPGQNIYMVTKQALQLLQLPPSDADDTVSFTFNDTRIVVTWADESSEEVVARYYDVRRTLKRFQENWS